ncbi:MAG TPA: hypothetical protein VG935_04805 [Patescibacteria group bacterium]|nr:hypothetical protein [Patescibacteria group bacterium]
MPKRAKKTGKRTSRKIPNRVRLIIGLIFITGFIALILGKTIKAPVASVTEPAAHISFSIPGNYTITQNEYSRIGIVFDVIGYAPGTPAKQVSDFKNKDIKVEYQGRRPYTPNSYHIAFTDSHTVKVDPKVLLPKTSSFSPDQLTIYSYALGDDLGHGRGDYGTAYAGDLRLDFETPEHVRTSEAIFINCIDPHATSAYSASCELVIRNFLGSLTLTDAAAIASPPSFGNSHYFAAISSTKRNFLPDEQILWNRYLTSPDKAFPYFSDKDAQLTQLPDSDLQSLRCMLQKLYLVQDGYPTNVSLKYFGSPNLFSFRTTDSGNLYYKVFVNDPELLTLEKNVSRLAGQNSSELTSFIACKTDSGYVVKYNRVKIAPYHQGDQSVNYVKEPQLVAEIATIDKSGTGQSVVSIPLPKELIYCERPLALTTNNIFYMACDVLPDMDESIIGKRYIYRIDINHKSYSLLSTCRYPYGDDSAGATTSCQ